MTEIKKNAHSHRVTGKRHGPPSKFTPEVCERFVAAIRDGMTYRLASQSAGISYEAFRQWRLAALDGDKKYAEFIAQVEAAEAEGARENLLAIEDARIKDWRAAAWLLERRHPTEFGPRSSLAISNDVERPVTIDDLLRDREE